MKIVEQTADRLVIRLRPNYFLGVLFALTGVIAFGISLALRDSPDTDGDPLIGVAVGAIFLLIGLGLIALLEDRIFTFDRADNNLTMRAGNLIRRRHLNFPLDEIVGAEVVEDTDSDGGTTYALQLVFREGRPMQLTQVQTSRKTGRAKVAKAINSFLLGRVS
jgi:hypothetical protein